MFEEMLVITLLIAIFFVVFYIIYNNKCGCNNNSIENFEDDSASNYYAFYSKDLNKKIKDIENQLMILSKNPIIDTDQLYNSINSIRERVEYIENRLDNYSSLDITDKLDEKIQDIENRLDNSTGNSIDEDLLEEINKRIIQDIENILKERIENIKNELYKNIKDIELRLKEHSHNQRRPPPWQSNNSNYNKR